MTPIHWQRIEGGLVFIGGISAVQAIASIAPVWPLWAVLLIFFAPDLSFFGYLMGPRVGASVYNTLHLYGAGLILMAVGLTVGLPMATVSGLLWTAHVGFDRMLGYGLKEPTGFSDTHLGRIGRKG